MRGLTLNELIQWKPPYQEYIISNDILLTQGTMMIYGAEGVWKSMMALDFTFRISIGKDWFNFKTIASSVYYFQSEIPQTPLRKRAMKYALGNSIASDNLWLCTDLYEKINTGWGKTQMENELQRTQPKVLFIDPISFSTSVKLVDDYEVEKLLSIFNYWRKEYKLAIVLVHHSRQAEHGEGETYHYSTDEIFGSSRFKRWLDTIVYVELTNDSDPFVNLKLTFEKTRHSEAKILPIEIQVDRRDLTFKRATIIGGM